MPARERGGHDAASCPLAPTRLTTIEFVVLGLIAEQPRHGYEVAAEIERRRLRNWAAIGFSSVYHVLNKLERLGLLDDKVRQEGKTPPQRVYAVTEQGQRVLRERLKETLAVPRSALREIELALMFAHFLPYPELRTCLQDYQRQVAARLQDEKARWRQSRGSPYQVWVDLIYGHSLRHLSAERTWVSEALTRLPELRRACSKF